MTLNEVLILNNFRGKGVSLRRSNNMNSTFRRKKVRNSIEKSYILM